MLKRMGIQDFSGVTVEHLLFWTFNSHWSMSCNVRKTKGRKIIRLSIKDLKFIPFGYYLDRYIERYMFKSFNLLYASNSILNL